MDAATGIHQANERFREAVREGDSARMPLLYTRDAAILPPNGDAVRGADAIAQFWQAFSELGIADARPVTEEVIALGDHALEIGTYSIHGSGDEILDRGKIMVLWKREEGVWKMHRDTWNSSVPPPDA